MRVCLQVALLETAPGNPTLQWSWVSRGEPEQGINRVQAVNIPTGGASSSSSSGSGSGLLEQAIAGVLAGYGGAASSILSSAGRQQRWTQGGGGRMASSALLAVYGVCGSVLGPEPCDMAISSCVSCDSRLLAASRCHITPMLTAKVLVLQQSC
jgi:hypothetical protein